MADYDPPEFEPPLVPHFPVQVFGPTAPCPHKGDYPEGSALCCVQCHKSGRDHWKIFRNVQKPPDRVFKEEDLEHDPFLRATRERWIHYNERPSDLEPEPTGEEKPKPRTPDEPKLTRRERRRRAFAAIVQTMAPSPPPSA